MPQREQGVPPRLSTAMPPKLNFLEQRPRAVDAFTEAPRQQESVGLQHQDQRLGSRIRLAQCFSAGGEH
jgi:hypothetical protein